MAKSNRSSRSTASISRVKDGSKYTLYMLVGLSLIIAFVALILATTTKSSEGSALKVPKLPDSNFNHVLAGSEGGLFWTDMLRTGPGNERGAVLEKGLFLQNTDLTARAGYKFENFEINMGGYFIGVDDTTNNFTIRNFADSGTPIDLFTGRNGFPEIGLLGPAEPGVALTVYGDVKTTGNLLIEGTPTSANHVITKGNLDTYVHESSLDLGGFGIVNVLDPVDPQDAATKAYVDKSGSLYWQDSVIGSIGTEPIEPVKGDRYIVSSAWGDGNTNDIAEFTTEWTFVIPDNGYSVWNNEVAAISTFDGIEWTPLSGATSHIGLIDVDGGNSTEQYHLTFSQWNYASVLDQSLSTTSSPSFSGMTLGGLSMGGALNMNANQVQNVGTPTLAQDAVNKLYVDAFFTNGVHLLSSAAVLQIASIGSATFSASQWLQLSDIDQGLSTFDSPAFSGALLSGNLDMNGNTVVNLSDPSVPQDAATKNYVDSIQHDDLPGVVGGAIGDRHHVTAAQSSLLSGMDQSLATSDSPTFVGLTLTSLAMGGNTISDVSDPISPQDAATKAYADALVANGSNTLSSSIVSQLSNIAGQTIGGTAWSSVASMQPVSAASSPTFAGLTLSGSMDAGGSALTNVATPTGASDASTKGYVDGLLSNGLSGLTSAEVTQLANIDAHTISNTKWGYLSALNQDLSTTSIAGFAALVVGGPAILAGSLNMGFNRIENVSDPSGNQDAATKLYVDTQVAGLNFADPVLSQFVGTIAPGAPTTGDRYIALSTWVTVGNLPNDILEWGGSNWIVTTPAVGTELYDQNLSTRVSWNGTAWMATSTTVHNSMLSIQGGTTNEYFHFTSAQHTTLSTITQNMATTDSPVFGGMTLNGALAMGTSKITGLGTPTLAADAVTKAYADALVSNGVSALSASEITQLANIDATTISGAQWGYVGTMTQSVASSASPTFAGVTLSAIMDAGAQRLTNVGTPTASSDAVTKSYADSLISNGSNALSASEIAQLTNIDTTTISIAQWGHVGTMTQSVAASASPSFAGLTMTGHVNMGGIYTLENLAFPVASTDAANKAYVDALVVNGVNDLTASEVTQLKNIGPSTISALQWAFVGGMNQSVLTSSAPSFTGLTVTADLNANGNTVTNLATPVNSGDAVPLLYVNTLLANDVGSLTASEVNQLKEIGTSSIGAAQWGHLAVLNQNLRTTDAVQFGIITAGGDIVMGNNKITGLSEPASNQDAATKNYVDSKTSDQVTSTTSDVAFNSVGLGDGAALTPALNFTSDPDSGAYLAGAADVRVAVSGADKIGFDAAGVSIYATIDMQNHPMSLLADPTAAQDAATKNYVDGSIASALTNGVGALSTAEVTQLAAIGEVTTISAANWARLGGLSYDLDGTGTPTFAGVTTSALNMSGSKITNLDHPVASTDAATKSYVDSVSTLISNGVELLTTDEVLQLANLNGTTVSSVQWDYLGAMDQAVSSTSSIALGGLTMGANFISNVLDPVLSQDAATKSYVDAQVAGLNFEDPVISQLAGTLAPVGPTTGDRYIALGVWTTELNTANDIMEWSGAVWIATSPAIGTELYDQNLSTRVSYNGSSWVTTSVTSHNGLTGLQGGNGSTEYYHLNFASYGFASAMDQSVALASAPSFSGMTLSGPLAMGGSMVTGLGAPSLTSDAATKGYVDSTSALYVLTETATIPVGNTVGDVHLATGVWPTLSNVTNDIMTYNGVGWDIRTPLKGMRAFLSLTGSSVEFDGSSWVSRLILDPGSSGNMAISWRGDLDTGMYSSGDGITRFRCNGVETLYLSPGLMTFNTDAFSSNKITASELATTTTGIADLGSTAPSGVYNITDLQSWFTPKGFVRAGATTFDRGTVTEPLVSFTSSTDSGLYLTIQTGVSGAPSALSMASNGDRWFTFGDKGYNVSYAPVDMRSFRIEDLGAPVNATDAATKAYVEAHVAATIGDSNPTYDTVTLPAGGFGGALPLKFVNGPDTSGIHMANGSMVLSGNDHMYLEHGQGKGVRIFDTTAGDVTDHGIELASAYTAGQTNNRLSFSRSIVTGVAQHGFSFVQVGSSQHASMPTNARTDAFSLMRQNNSVTGNLVFDVGQYDGAVRWASDSISLCAADKTLQMLMVPEETRLFDRVFVQDLSTYNDDTNDTCGISLESNYLSPGHAETFLKFVGDCETAENGFVFSTSETSKFLTLRDIEDGVEHLIFQANVDDEEFRVYYDLQCFGELRVSTVKFDVNANILRINPLPGRVMYFGNGTDDSDTPLTIDDDFVKLGKPLRIGTSELSTSGIHVRLESGGGDVYLGSGTGVSDTALTVSDTGVLTMVGRLEHRYNSGNDQVLLHASGNAGGCSMKMTSIGDAIFENTTGDIRFNVPDSYSYEVRVDGRTQLNVIDSLIVMGSVGNPETTVSIAGDTGELIFNGSGVIDMYLRYDSGEFSMTRGGTTHIRMADTVMFESGITIIDSSKNPLETGTGEANVFLKLRSVAYIGNIITAASEWGIGADSGAAIASDATDTDFYIWKKEHGETNWSIVMQLLDQNAGSVLSNFTGQHRSKFKNDAVNNNNLDDFVGKIVVSTGQYSIYDDVDGRVITGQDAITINDAIPVVELVSKPQDKRVFGVVSDMEDDDRTLGLGPMVLHMPKALNDRRLHINSLGEGGIWVTDLSGPIENGDYVTSSACPGYGQLQSDDLLHNYTVAKSTCDCDFDLSSTEYKCEEVTYVEDGVTKTCKAAFIGCTYHCG